MKEIVLKVYDKNGNVAKESAAIQADIMFGTVRKLMRLFRVDELNNTAQLFKAVVGAWDEVTGILSECFPDITEEDWDNVKLKELVPAIVSILGDSFSEILTIPKEKNPTGK